jgi:hypothetical protein
MAITQLNGAQQCAFLRPFAGCLSQLFWQEKKLLLSEQHSTGLPDFL